MLGYRIMLRNRLFLVIALALPVGLLPIFVAEKPARGAGTLPNGFT
jgi:hypothetical protein